MKGVLPPLYQTIGVGYLLWGVRYWRGESRKYYVGIDWYVLREGCGGRCERDLEQPALSTCHSDRKTKLHSVAFVLTFIRIVHAGCHRRYQG